MHGNKTQDTENLRDCPKVCVKNTDFRVCATTAVSFYSSFFLQQISNKNIITILVFRNWYFTVSPLLLQIYHFEYQKLNHV